MNINNRLVIDCLQRLPPNHYQEYSCNHVAIFLIGANGSGKSSLRHYLDLSHITTNIDPDDLKLKNGGDHNLAARQAIDYCAMAIKYRNSFCRESTLSGRTILEAIKKAKASNYYVIGYFVGLESVDQHLERIKYRVAHGGHNIEDEVVKRRYRQSILNLTKVAQYFDQLHVVDNSGFGFVPQFSIHQGKLFTKEQLNNIILASFSNKRMMKILDRLAIFKWINPLIHSVLLFISITLPISLCYLTIELWREILVYEHYYCSNLHHVVTECTRGEAIIDKSFSLILFPLIVIGFWVAHYGYVSYRMRHRKLANLLSKPLTKWAHSCLSEIAT